MAPHHPSFPESIQNGNKKERLPAKPMFSSNYSNEVQKEHIK